MFNDPRSVATESLRHAGAHRASAASVEFRFDANHDFAFRPGGAEIGRQNEMECNRIGPGSFRLRREQSGRAAGASLGEDRLRPRRPARDKRARPRANARRSSPTHAIPGRCRCSRCRSRCECAIQRDKSSAPRALRPQAAAARRSRPRHSPPSITPARLHRLPATGAGQEFFGDRNRIGLHDRSLPAGGRRSNQLASRQNGLALISRGLVASLVNLSSVSQRSKLESKSYEISRTPSLPTSVCSRRLRNPDRRPLSTQHLHKRSRRTAK